jgi:hypothetical protein
MNDSERSMANNLTVSVPLAIPSTITSPAAPTEYDDDYDRYVDAALADAAGFVQISASFFVAQGWESRSATATVNTSNTCIYYENIDFLN